MKPTRSNPVAFRKIRAADLRRPAMIPANRKSGSRAGCSKAAPTYALRIIAADTVQQRATRSQLIPPQATLDFVVSFASRGGHEVERQSRPERAITCSR